MDVKVFPGKLYGTITVPPSKSSAHRALICAALSEGTSILFKMGDNDDIKASIDCAKALGAKCHVTSTTVTVTGFRSLVKKGTFHCNESGSTLRFFTPIVAALGINADFTGEGKLPTRPMEPLLSLLENHGTSVENNSQKLFSITGQLTSGVYKIPGNISSQYITGLLFALPMLSGNSEIKLTTSLDSKGYVDLTIQMMSIFGVKVFKKNSGYMIPGNQSYISQTHTIEGDFSSGAFWIAAMCLGHKIKLKGLRLESLQADKKMLSIVKKMGGIVHIDNDQLWVEMNEIKPIIIDGNAFPDSVPILSIVAANAAGTTQFINSHRLRLKECDRLEAMAKGLSALGASVEQIQDGLIVNGDQQLKGGIVHSFGDHRIAMSFAIAALNASEPIIITKANVVSKSYPSFYEDFKQLGGEVHVL